MTWHLLNVRVSAIALGEIDADVPSPGASKIVKNDIPMRHLAPWAKWQT